MTKDHELLTLVGWKLRNVEIDWIKKLTLIIQISELKQKSSTKELSEKIVQKIVQRVSEYFPSFSKCF